MNHEEAIRARAADKYLLGQMQNGESDAFEKHFFECHICAEEIRAGVVFADNAAAELKQTPNRWVPAAEKKSFWRDFFGAPWRTPGFALAALAVICVLWVADRARLSRELVAAEEPQMADQGEIRGPLRGGPPASVERANNVFVATFAIYNDAHPAYSIHIAGNGTPPVTLRAKRTKDQTYSLLLPLKRYPPGHYDITVDGADGEFVETLPLELK